MPDNLDEVFAQQEESQTETSPETVENDESSQQEEVKIEEKKEEEPAVQIEEVKLDEKPDVPPPGDEVNELRQFIREQRKEIAAMKAKLSRVKEDNEVDDEGNVKVKYTPLEILQIELHNVAVQRAPLLEVLVDTMSDNPRYSDVYDVCTKQNFDTIFEMAAERISREERRDFNEVLLQIELEVWKKSNPYKYMYNIIKEYHPKFIKQKTETIEKPKEKPSITAAKVIEPKDAPGSIAAAGSVDGKSSSAWTAARIDELDEIELHTVPKDVYKQYMMGKLK